jgi:hypothetical protein
LTISATGGSAGSESGDGGTVKVTAGGTLTVNPPALTVAPLGDNGNGGEIELTAGKGDLATSGEAIVQGSLSADGVGEGNGGKITLTSAVSRVFVNGSLSASASGAGNGGEIKIELSASSGFVVGPTATSNSGGVVGMLTAAGGPSGGSGGTLTIDNKGTGGIRLNALADISVAASAAGGNGGRIDISSALGTITLADGMLSADAVGSGEFAGGSVSLTGASSSFTGTNAVVLSANGSGTGQGGDITLATTGLSSDITVGSAAAQFTLSATGGSAASAAGDGGTIRVSAGRSLTVDPAALIAGPVGINGAGATLELKAGQASGATGGNVVVNGSLSADGVGAPGDGGAITLESPVGRIFVDGSLSADGGTGGSGGVIKISANTGSNFTIGGSATSQTGGVIGPISASAGSAAGSAGTIDIENKGTGGLRIVSPPDLIVAPAPDGNGGTIKLSAPAGQVLTGSGYLQAPRGAAGGQQAGTIAITGLSVAVISSVLTIKAGTIDVSVTGSSADITIGAGSQQIQLLGTNLSVSAGRNLTVDASSLVVEPTLTHMGGHVALTAGSAGGGNLLITGNLDVSGPSGFGTGTGNGGEIALSAASSQAFVIGGTAGITNGIIGTIKADGSGTGGDGGKIGITNNGSGGVRFNSSASVTATASSAGGNGGEITITAPLGSLSIVGGTVSANASATGVFDGGKITLSGVSQSAAGPSPLLLSANGSSGGTGGSVEVTTTSGNLTVGASGGQFSISVLSGGSVKLSAGGSLTVDGLGLLVSTPTACAGGQIAMEASTAAGTGTELIPPPPGGTITLSGIISAGEGSDSSISIKNSAGGVQQSSGTLVAGKISIDVGANVGSSSARILTETGSLKVTATGNVFITNAGPVVIDDSSAGSTLDLASTGTITAAGGITAGTLTFMGTTGSNASIFVLSDLTVNGTALLNADGSGVISVPGGVITANTVNLASGTGNIGSANVPVSTIARSLSANTLGSAFLMNSGNNLTLNTSAVGDTIVLTVDRNVTVNGPLSGTDITIQGTPGADAAITVGNNITVSGMVTLAASGSGRIATSGGALVTAPTVMLSTVTGDIGSSGTPFALSTASVTAASGGDVFLRSVSLGAVSVESSSAGSVFQLTASGNIVVDGAILANRITLQGASGSTAGIAIGANVTASGSGSSVTLKATGTGSITQSAGLISAATVALSAETGNIGSQPSNIVTAAGTLMVTTAGSAFVSTTGSVQLGASTVGGTYELTSTGAINVSQSISANVLVLDAGGTITATSSSVSLIAPTMDLISASGDIGTASVPISLSTASLAVSTPVIVRVKNIGSLTLRESSAGAFELSTPGTVTTGGDVTVTGAFQLNASGLTNAHVVTGDTISVTGPAGQNLTIGGGGTLEAVNGIFLTATNSSSLNRNLVFDNLGQNFVGVAVLNAPEQGQSVIVNAPVSGDSTVIVNSCTVVGMANISAPEVVVNCPTGAGAIVQNGDLQLTGSLVFAGKSLTIMASGDITAAAKATSINLSSKAGEGGNLTIIAGFDFTSNTFGFTVGSPSASGGSVILPKTAITTSAGAKAAGKDAGSVTVVAHAGLESDGVISLGSIKATAGTATGGAGGDVKLFGQGGVQVGAIDVRGTAGGTVLIAGATPVIAGGSIIVDKSGAVYGSGSFQPAAPTPGAGAAVFVNGDIFTSGTATGAGGAVTISADSQIEVVKSITALGGGAASLTTLGSIVSVGTGINTSALAVASAGSALSGGNVSVQASTFVTIGGNIVTTGGANTGTGAAGDAGSITLSTSNSTPNNFYTGGVSVKGFIDARGGAAAAGADGDGGDVTVTAGTLQVLALNKAGSASINTSDGDGVGGGVVDINTYATQPIPQDFDLTSSVKDVIALPGGLFTVGTAAPVNGVAGNIVSGTAVASLATVNGGTGRVYSSSPVTIGGITIEVNGGDQTIQEGGNPTVVTVDNGSGVRTLVTPAEALALFNVSRGAPSQGVILNASGQALSGSSVTVPDLEIARPFTAFNLQAIDAPTSGIELNVSGLRPVLVLPSTGGIIGGMLSFGTANSTVLVDFGTGAMNVLSGGSISGSSTSTVILSGSAAVWTNSGLIEAKDIAIARAGTKVGQLTFVLSGANATIQGSAGAVDPRIVLSTSLGPAVSVAFQANGANFDLPVEFARVSVPTMYKTLAQTNASTFTSAKAVSVSFALSDPSNSAITAAVQGTLSAGSLAISGLLNNVGTPTPVLITNGADFSTTGAVTISSVGNVTIDSSSAVTAGTTLTVNSGGSLEVYDSTLSGTQFLLQSSGALTVGDSSALSALSSGTLTSAGNLAITQGAVVHSDKTLVLSSTGAASSLSIDLASQVNAGVLSPSAPLSGPLISSDVISAGAVTISSAGSNGIFVMTNAVVAANGGNVTVVSANPSNELSVETNGELAANGGGIAITMAGSTQLGDAAMLTARSLNGGSGTVAISSAQGVNLTEDTVVTAANAVSITSSAGAVNIQDATVESQAGAISVTGASVTAELDAVLQAAGALSMLSTTGATTIETGAVLSAGTTMSLTGASQVTVGANETISALKSITLTATGLASSVSIGSGATITAGLLQPSAPSSGPLSTADILSAGSLTVSARGTGGVNVGSGAVLEANGGAISVSALAKGGGSVLAGSAAELHANGGSVSVAAVTQISFGADAVIDARTLQGSQGNISVKANQGVTVGAGSAMTAGGSLDLLGGTGNVQVSDTALGGASRLGISGVNVQLNGSTVLTSANGAVSAAASGAMTVADGVDMSSGKQMSLSAGGTLTVGDAVELNAGGTLSLSMGAAGATLAIGSGATFSGGILQAGAPPTGPLVSANITQSGSVSITSSGTGGITVGAGGSFTSNGGNVSFAAGAGSVDIADNNQLTANGGNVSVSASGQASVHADVTISARMLNNGAGTVSITGAQAVSMDSGSTVSSGSHTTLSSSGGTVLVTGSIISAEGNVTFSGLGGVSVLSSSVTSTGASLTMTTSGTLALGPGVDLTTLGNLTLTGGAGLTVGTGSALTASKSLSLTASGTGSSLVVDSAASLSAGELQAGAPAAGPLSSFDVAVAGSVKLSSAGAGGVDVRAGTTIVTNGGSITIGATGKTASIVTLGSGVELTANGGDVAITSGKSGQVSSGAAVIVSARTLGNKAGAISVSAGQAVSLASDTSLQAAGSIKLSSTLAGVSVGDDSELIAGATLSAAAGGALTIGEDAVVTAGTTLTASAKGALLVGADSQLTAGTTLTASAVGALTVGAESVVTAARTISLSTTGGVLTVGSDASLSAGALTPTAPVTGVLAKTDIASSGAVTLRGGAGVELEDGVSLVSNGADVSVTASLSGADLNIGAGGQFQANGGNVIMLASGQVSGGAGNSFLARAVGTASSSTGGAIEIGSGTTKSLLKIALKLPANTNPPAGALGVGVIINNSNGVVVANNTGGVINLNPGPGSPSALTLNRGYMQFDAIGPAGSVVIDNSNFQTDAFKPISFGSNRPPVTGADDELVVDTGDVDDSCDDIDSLLEAQARP